MKTVLLSLPLEEDEHTEIEVSVELSDSELNVLRRFIALVERVRSSAWLQRGMGGFKGFQWDRGKITITAEECTDAELHELLHVLRPVTLDNEPFGFHRARAILARHIEEGSTRAFLKLCGRVFRHGQMSLYMQFSLGDQRMFHESLLNVWLNGTQYHTDEDKASAWQALEASLTAPNARAVIISQLHGKVLGLLNVDAIARRVVLAYDA